MRADRGDLSAGDKIVCYDAIRGLAALLVVFAHTMLVFWPGVYFRTGPAWDRCPVWLQWPYRFPGKFLVNGKWIVPVFYIVSGFVLSLPYFRGKGAGSAVALGSAAARRYLRLVIPVAASIFLAYALVKTGAMCNQEAVAQLNDVYGIVPQRGPPPGPGKSNNWLAAYYDFSPSFWSAGREALWGAFTGLSQYNMVLYTMPVELVGSFLVYGFLALFGGLRNRWLLYGVAGGSCILDGRLFLLDFVLGMASCDLWHQNQLSWRRSLPLNHSLGLVAVAIFLLPWGHLTAFLVVAAVVASPRLQQLLSTRWLARLGLISFGLFVIHMPIYCSLGCGLYLFSFRYLGWSHGAGSVAASLASLTCSLLGAWAFYCAVDRPSIALTRGLDIWLFRPRADNGVRARTEIASGRAEDRVPRAA
jgi:peptidoglycan/LPS O-acetylase OafA/YrhL